MATTVHIGICDEDRACAARIGGILGIAAGCGQFFTLGQKIGHIGQSVRRGNIRY